MPTPAPSAETIPEETCEAAFRGIAQSCAQALDASLAVFLETDDPSGPHKARVALRRLTTALDAFGPILRRKASAALRSHAKAMFRDLGRVRDSDVHLMNADPGLGAKATKELADRNRRLRDKTRDRLRKSRMVRFTQVLRVSVQDGGTLFRRSHAAQDRRAAPVTDFAAEALGAAWATCRAYGPSVKAIPDLKRHDFRKDMKTLRYLAEFFADHFPDLRETVFLRDFRKMQDALGTLNDFMVALEIEGRSLPDPLPPKVVTALNQAEALWKALHPATLPWGSQATRLP